MVLFYVTVVCVLFGSAAGVEYEKVCYGKSLKLPFFYTPPLFNGKLYFTPSGGRSRKLLMDKGEAKDPRLKISISSTELTDLTEKDEGTFSISYDGERLYNVIKLTIRDCAQKLTMDYGSKFYCDIPRLAEFLEFTPLHSADQPKVLWNRTNPQTNTGGRGQAKRNVWEIMDVTQADMGHYNFRARDNTLMSRKLLTVQEYKRHYYTKVNERLVIKNPPAVAPWTVTFTPERGGEDYTLMKAGDLLLNDWYSQNMAERIWAIHDGIEIYPVESTDSGTFEFRDPQGNLAQTVNVEVEHEPTPAYVYVGIAGGIILTGIILFCCVRKCCCKKSSSKRDKSVSQTAATPAVYYHDLNQPGGPSYSDATAQVYSHQPMNPLVSREPKTTSLEPSVYRQVNIHVNSSQPEVAPLGGQSVDPPPLLGSDCLSSDPEPKFELKGLLSAPPLSSDSTFCHVYTSDKLNFL